MCPSARQPYVERGPKEQPPLAVPSGQAAVARKARVGDKVRAQPPASHQQRPSVEAQHPRPDAADAYQHTLASCV